MDTLYQKYQSGSPQIDPFVSQGSHEINGNIFRLENQRFTIFVSNLIGLFYPIPHPQRPNLLGSSSTHWFTTPFNITSIRSSLIPLVLDLPTVLREEETNLRDGERCTMRVRTSNIQLKEMVFRLDWYVLKEKGGKKWNIEMRNSPCQGEIKLIFLGSLFETRGQLSLGCPRHQYILLLSEIVSTPTFPLPLYLLLTVKDSLPPTFP